MVYTILCEYALHHSAHLGRFKDSSGPSLSRTHILTKKGMTYNKYMNTSICAVQADYLLVGRLTGDRTGVVGSGENGAPLLSPPVL